MKRKRFDNSRAPTQIEDLPQSPHVPRWSGGTSIAFRFSFLYFLLFSLATQIAGSLFLVPNSEFRGFGPLWPMREITSAVALYLFGAAEPPAYTAGSGETLFHWIQTFWLLLFAGAGTLIWSALDGRRASYSHLNKWFRLFIRAALAATMFEYGMTKIIPNQFPAPSLNILVTPAGSLSLETMLWTSIGASPPYQIFTGCIEVFGGVLLLVPRTTMLGALVCLGATAHVFVLNMTYDIGLKLISFHLVLLTLLLLSPEMPRLADFLLRNRATPPSGEAPLFHSLRANRIAVALQIAFGLYLLGMYAHINWRYWHTAGEGSPRSPLYGIWNVDRVSIDGEVGPPELNDYDRQWRRVIFDSPDSMVIQRLDDSFARYRVSIDASSNALTLSKGNSQYWKARFNFQRPSQKQLILDGEMDGHRIQTQLYLLEFDTLRLLNSNFRWVRPNDP